MNKVTSTRKQNPTCSMDRQCVWQCRCQDPCGAHPVWSQDGSSEGWTRSSSCTGPTGGLDMSHVF